MKNRSGLIKFVQIGFAAVGLFLAGLTVVSLIDNMIIISKGNIAGFFGIVLLVALQIITSIGSAVAGLVTMIIAIKQRRNEETKDKFSLTMLIIGISILAIVAIVWIVFILFAVTNN